MCVLIQVLCCRINGKITDISDVITHDRNLKMNVAMLVLLFCFLQQLRKTVKLTEQAEKGFSFF